MTAGNEARLISRLTRRTRSGCVSGSSTSGQVICSVSSRGSARRRLSGSTTNSLTRFASGVSASPPHELSAIDIFLDYHGSVQCSTVGLDADPIIDGVLKALLTAKISLGRVDGDMAEQKLNLVQFPTSIAAEAGAGATIMPRAA